MDDYKYHIGKKSSDFRKVLKFWDFRNFWGFYKIFQIFVKNFWDLHIKIFFKSSYENLKKFYNQSGKLYKNVKKLRKSQKQFYNNPYNFINKNLIKFFQFS